ncbi:hypothetical protein PspKH34_21260 [Parageobacillus sp. KH3-4]|nr:hypothetical protein PspKH34_21260 [Parageobacillus sp. KH3-4]
MGNQNLSNDSHSIFNIISKKTEKTDLKGIPNMEFPFILLAKWILYECLEPIFKYIPR